MHPRPADRERNLAGCDFLFDAKACSFPIKPVVFAFLIGRIGAGVPDDHVAGAVLPLRDRTFEVEVVQWVVFGLLSTPLYRRICRWPLWHGKRLEHASCLKAQVVVQCRRLVFLNDKS